MALLKYPTFAITDDSITADQFRRYYHNNPHLQPVHKHSFYHLLYFTEGAGEHIIDFVHFPVVPGMIYFMRPGQMHKWNFRGAVDGYVVNFSPTFFEHVGMDSRVVDGFSFFRSDVKDQVLQLSPATRKAVEALFGEMVAEHTDRKQLSVLRIAALLLELFITVERDHFPVAEQEAVSYNATLLRNFRDLIDTHFASIRLPKDYGGHALHHAHHLNALCKDLLGVPAGQLIRDRIVLEAKRLLSNFELPIGEIARELNFPDSSYFVKFFKKYTGTTPEIFRKRNVYENRS